MRKTWISIFVLALVCAMLSTVRAGEGDSKRPARDDKAKKDVDQARRYGHQQVGKKLSKLGLSDEQVKAIGEGMKDARTKAQDADEDEREKIMHSAMLAIVKRVVDDVKLHLIVLNTLLRAERDGGILPRPDLGLTKEQVQAIRQAMDEAAGKARGAKKEDRDRIMRSALEAAVKSVVKDVAKQKKVLHAMTRGAGGDKHQPDFGLTDDQKNALAKIDEDSKKWCREAKGVEAKTQAMKARRKAIDEFMEKNLSVENLKKYRELQNRSRGGRRPDLGMTDKQKQAFEELRNDCRKKIKDAEGNEAKQEATTSAYKTIDEFMKVNLSAENLKKYYEWRNRGNRQKDKRPDPDAKPKRE